MNNTKQICLTLEKETIERLDKHSIEENRSRSNCTNLILKKFFGGYDE